MRDALQLSVAPAATVSVPASAPLTALGFVVVSVLAPLPAMLATRHQYTWSLLLFALPAAFMAVELSLRGHLATEARHLGRALALLVPMGVALNLAFAADFFTYENPAAVLGLTVPGLRLSGVDWAHRIPVEEFCFYGLGFFTVLLAYRWAARGLFGGHPLGPDAGGWMHALAHPAVYVGVPVALVALGTGLQRAMNPGAPFPSYWAYLMLLPVPLTLKWLPGVHRRINWAAFTFTEVSLLAVSVLWEASLAVPNGWWGYQPRAMVGLFLHPWHDLPVEAVVVWLLTPLTSIVVLEHLQSRAARGGR